MGSLAGISVETDSLFSNYFYAFALTNPEICGLVGTFTPVFEHPFDRRWAGFLLQQTKIEAQPSRVPAAG